MTPLRQLLSIPDHVEFWIAQNIGTILFKQTGHVLNSCAAFQVFRTAPE
ncbi:hypothetical protein [Aquimixticola soesokkakensis]|nr:hypothetical protein [Aquimixticola soesokkakensis]